MAHEPTHPTRREILGYAAAAPALWLDPDGRPRRPLSPEPKAAAWELVQRAATLFRDFTPRTNELARQCAEEALSLDPTCVRAACLLCAAYRQEAIFLWPPDPLGAAGATERWGREAVRLARLEEPPQPSLPYALEQLGFVLLYQRRHAEALAMAEEALRCEPVIANAHGLAAMVAIYRGLPDVALAHSAAALAIDPRGSHFYAYHQGQASYVLGALCEADDSSGAHAAYTQAETHLRTSLAQAPNYRSARTYLVATLMALGRDAAAQAENAVLRAQGRMSALDPQFAAHVMRTHPYVDQTITRGLLARLEMAEVVV